MQNGLESLIGETQLRKLLNQALMSGSDDIPNQ
jgi:hypothetical protein